MTPDSLPEDRKRQINALLKDIADETIDKNDWDMKRGDPVINEFRARKPDVEIEMDCPECNGKGAVGGHRCYHCRGNKRIPDERWARGEIKASQIQYAQAQVRSILNWLFDEGHISSAQLDAGYSYHIWRDYFAAMWAGRQSGSCWYEIKDAFATGDPITERSFLVLLQKLTRRDQRIVDMAVDTKASHHATWAVSRQVHLYAAALGRLVTLIEWARDYPLTEAPKLARD